MVSKFPTLSPQASLIFKDCYICEFIHFLILLWSELTAIIFVWFVATVFRSITFWIPFAHTLIVAAFVCICLTGNGGHFEWSREKKKCNVRRGGHQAMMGTIVFGPRAQEVSPNVKWSLEIFESFLEHCNTTENLATFFLGNRTHHFSDCSQHVYFHEGNFLRKITQYPPEHTYFLVRWLINLPWEFQKKTHIAFKYKLCQNPIIKSH